MTPAWRPTPVQERLLDACLLEDEDRALEALAAWRREAPLERLDHGSYRLLPLLWARHAGAGLDEASRGLIRGVYRRTWYHNQLLLAHARGLASALEREGILAMALKGAALTLRHYQDSGARPMRDLDLAVPAERAAEAVAVLVDAGWTPEPTPLTATMTPTDASVAGWRPGPRPQAAFDRWYFGVRHAHGLTGPAGAGVDLHWHLFEGDCEDGADARSWAGAARLTDGSPSLLAPADHEHLLLLLAHGARWNPVPTVRWVADVVTLIRRSPALDWDGFVVETIRRRLTLPAAELLRYATSRYGLPVPASALEQLRACPVPRAARRAYRRSVSRPTVLTGWDELRYLRARYRALRREAAPGTAPSFARFTCGVLGADRVSQLAGYSAREGWRRLRGRR